MCAKGWLVTQISWTAIGWVLAYTVVWVFVMDIIKKVTYAIADGSDSNRAKHHGVVTQSLKSYPH